MTMPGFTAEASLHSANESYRAVGASLTASTNQVVVPQWCWPWDYALCGVAIAGCLGGCLGTGPAFVPCMELCLRSVGAAGCAACLTP
jgi:hypothetical protein